MISFFKLIKNSMDWFTSQNGGGSKSKKCITENFLIKGTIFRSCITSLSIYLVWLLFCLRMSTWRKREGTFLYEENVILASVQISETYCGIWCPISNIRKVRRIEYLRYFQTTKIRIGNRKRLFWYWLCSCSIGLWACHGFNSQA